MQSKCIPVDLSVCESVGNWVGGTSVSRRYWYPQVHPKQKRCVAGLCFCCFFLHLFWFFWKAAPFRGLNIWYILMLVLNFTSLFCKEPIIPWIITIIKYTVLNNCIISAQISFLTECILFNTKINNMFSSMKVSIYCFIKKNRKNSKALAFIFNFIRVSGWLSCLSNWAVCWLKFGNKTWIQFIYGFKQLFDKLLKYLCFLFFIGVV